MKKQIMTILAVAGLATSVFGQGQVTLANNAATLIRYDDPAAGTPVPAGSTTFQLYAGVQGSSAASLTALTPTAGVNAVAAGRIANTIINVTQVAPGAMATFQIYAFASTFATFDDAFAAGAYTGKSILFDSATSPTGSPPPLPVSLAGKFPGFALTQVPEPSTIALGVLGAGSLLFLRRKK